MVNADKGEQEEALRLLHSVSFEEHQRTRMLIVEAYIHSSWEDYGQAIIACDKVLAIDPNQRDALRGKVLAMQNLLLPAQALEIAEAHPGILTKDEVAQLRSDWAAVQIRWANQTVKDKSSRDEPLDGTLNEMTAISRDFIENDNVQLRNRFDRIVALRTQQQMTETVAEFEQIAEETEFIPAYVLRAAAGAYLYLEQPKKAQELLVNALEQEPNSFDLNHDLFYVYVDLEQHQQAMDLAENMRNSEPVWRQLPGSHVIKSNPQRMQAEITAGVSLALADQLPESQARFEDLLARAPHNTDVRQELATVYRMRGWTNRALTEYQQVLSVEPDLASARVGNAHALLDRRHYDLADREISALVSDIPTRMDVVRLRQRWEQYNKHQFHVESSFGDSTGVQFGSEQYNVDGYFLVKPLAYRYRPFVHTSDAFAEFPEGDARRQRIGAGVEYRGVDWLGSLEIHGGRGDGGEIGFGSQIEWLADDHWSLAALLETNSNAAPLRGYRVGGANESRQISMSGERLHFSDGNERNNWSLQGRQRLFTRATYKLDLDGELFASNGSDQDVVYFNPEHDASFVLTAINEWRTYRRYDFAFTQQFNLAFGYYQQDSYGTSPIGSLQYLANVDFNRGLSAQVSVRHARNVYDGETEDSTFFTLAIAGSF
jgi:biofilm PGA synthesis protein PgaA